MGDSIQIPDPTRVIRQQIPVVFALLGAHVFILATLGGTHAGSMDSELLQSIINVFAVGASFAAARRSRVFGKRFWRLAGSAFLLLSIGALFNTYDDVVLARARHHWWLIDLFLNVWMAPLIMCLFLDPEAESEKMDWGQILDFSQVGIIITLVFLYFSDLPVRRIASQPWWFALALDAFITLGFFLRSFSARSSSTRELFSAFGYFRLLAVLTDIYFLFGLPGDGIWFGLVWSSTSMYGLLIPLSWKDTSTASASRSHYETPRLVIAHFLPLLFPVLVMAMASGIARGQLALAAIAVMISLALTSVRVLLNQRDRLRSEEALRQKKLLEMIASSTPITDVLEALVSSVREQCGLTISVELFNNNGAPLKIGGAVTKTDEKRSPDEKLPAHEPGTLLPSLGQSLPQNRTTSWLVPIRARDGSLLGRFVIHYRKPQTPSQRELEIVEVASRLAAIAGERKLFEDDLRTAEEKYRLLVEQQPAAITYARRLGMQGSLQYVSPQIEKLLGFSANEVIGTNGFWSRQLHTEDRDRVVAEQARCQNPGDQYRSEYRLKTKDGRAVWFREEGMVSRSTSSDGLIMRGILLDITERMTAEEARKRSEENFRSLVEKAPCGIFQSSQNGDHFLWANPHLMNMLGYSSMEELQTLSIARDVFVAPAESAAMIATAGQSSTFAREAEWQRKNGSRVKVRLIGRWLEDPQHADRRLQVIVEDITERSLLEQQLQQAQKMEAIGRLAGGVAHDFNNLLAVIIGHGEMLMTGLGTPDKMLHKVEQMTQAALRGSALTQQLLAFSRQQVAAAEVIDPHIVMSRIDHLLRRVIGEDIHLQLQVDLDVGCIRINQSQLEQIVLNLAINSRDAMPKGGIITISAKNVAGNRGRGQDTPATSTEQCVMLCVSDTGQGMNADTQAHVFEPFFTTKGMGKGTGLGLSTVYGIVKQAGGYIQIDSEVGKGTNVRIYFPLVATAAPEHEVASHTAQTRGTETILVVEDEPQLLEVAAETLAGHGYKILTAGNGPQALQVVSQYAGEIHMLVTDVVMPNMSGRELAERLADLRPGIKLLYMSGYTDGIIAGHGVAETGAGFLQKPFRPVALAAKVREIFDTHEPHPSISAVDAAKQPGKERLIQ